MYRFPKNNSLAFQLCKYLYEHGPATSLELAEIFKTTRQNAANLNRSGYTYFTVGKKLVLEDRIANFIKTGNAQVDKEPEKKENIVQRSTRDVFKGDGFVPSYMQCMRPEPEWVKRDSFGYSA